MTFNSLGVSSITKNYFISLLCSLYKNNEKNLVPTVGSRGDRPGIVFTPGAILGSLLLILASTLVLFEIFLLVEVVYVLDNLLSDCEVFTSFLFIYMV